MNLSLINFRICLMLRASDGSWLARLCLFNTMVCMQECPKKLLERLISMLHRLGGFLIESSFLITSLP